MCWHARAVRSIVHAEQDWVKAVNPEDAYDYHMDVELQHDSVQLVSLSSMSKDSLALSMSRNASGWPRVTVGSDRVGNLVCRSNRWHSIPGFKHKQMHRHCKHMCEWQKAIDQELNVLKDTGNDPAWLGRLSALAAELEGFQLLDFAQGQCPPHIRHPHSCPVSVSKIQPHIIHPVMQGRAQGRLAADY